MSTLNCQQKKRREQPPPWTAVIGEQMYHEDARSGRFLSSSLLREFVACPAAYHDILQGKARGNESDAMRLGKAAHKLILEGEHAYRGAFLVGGPFNERSGKYYASSSLAFSRWLDDNGLDRRAVVTPAEHEILLRLAESARRHPEIALLLGAGWPERSVRAVCDGVACQARLDWLRPDGVAVDLKTVADIARFEADAGRFGYLHQFAFYRDVALAAGAVGLDMVAVVLEKKPPFRAGVWRFSAETLLPYSAQNRLALARLLRCRERGLWPTGYEKPRQFPPAGIPPLWLN